MLDMKSLLFLEYAISFIKLRSSFTMSEGCFKRSSKEEYPEPKSSVKGLTHEGQEIGIEHLMITDVEVQGEVRIRAAYALGMDDCLLEDPASDSAYLLGALQDGDEYGRR